MPNKMKHTKQEMLNNKYRRIMAQVLYDNPMINTFYPPLSCSQKIIKITSRDRQVLSDIRYALEKEGFTEDDALQELAKYREELQGHAGVIGSDMDIVEYLVSLAAMLSQDKVNDVDSDNEPKSNVSLRIALEYATNKIKTSWTLERNQIADLISEINYLAWKSCSPYHYLTPSKAIGSTLDTEYLARTGEIREPQVEAGMMDVDDLVTKIQAIESGSGGCNDIDHDEAVAMVKSVLSCLSAPDPKPEGICEWSSIGEDCFSGSCGARWIIDDGFPRDHDIHYCPKCGKRIAIIPAAPEPKPEGE